MNPKNNIINKFPKSSHIFGSKSNTLKFLQEKIKKSKIESLYDFTVDEWKNNEKTILKTIFKFNSTIIVRSSAIGEDSLESSKAGNFLSVLDVNPKFQNSVKKAVNSVIQSYEQGDSNNKDNHVLIQNQSENISLSGVVFTRTPETASPYYVINYDKGQSTVSVTSGMVGNAIKIFRNINKKLLPKQWQNLLESIKEIEFILNLDKLDIEFGINKDGQVIIFQVRPMTFIQNRNVNQNDKKIKKITDNYFSKKLLSCFDLLGCFNFRKALASICLILSRVTENCSPTSSKV